MIFCLIYNIFFVPPPRLQDEISSFYHGTPSCQKANGISKGQLYLAVTGAPRVQLMRVRVLEVLSEDMARVLLLDHGGVMTLPVSSLYALPPNFLAKPMALPVKLGDIIPPGGSEVGRASYPKLWSGRVWERIFLFKN